MHEFSFQDDILPLKDKLFRLALRITMDRAEAEDVVEEAMVRVWEKRESYSNYDSVEAFCLVVTKNLALDMSQKKDAQNLSLDESMAESEMDESDPYHQLANNEKLKLIHRLINELPERQRLVMQLRDIEGESYKKIALVMNITEAQVKIDIFRARQKVKQRFLEIDGYGL
ncbi:MAG: RNA polymerase sigma factor [Bacteroidaceae bacterium]|nr:RNA polymerase sigma factor [Bacteroidaceae bacterium]